MVLNLDRLILNTSERHVRFKYIFACLVLAVLFQLEASRGVEIATAKWTDDALQGVFDNLAVSVKLQDSQLLGDSASSQHKEALLEQVLELDRSGQLPTKLNEILADWEVRSRPKRQSEISPSTGKCVINSCGHTT